MKITLKDLLHKHPLPFLRQQLLPASYMFS